MQKSMIILLAVLAIAIAGCSSKSNPTNTTPPPPPVRVIATTPASAPSLTDPNSAAWTGVAATAISVSDQNAAKIAPRGSASIAALPDSVYMQALRLHDTLYLRLRWHDATHDIWRGAFIAHDTLLNCDPYRTCVDFVRDTDTYKEDQAIVLFDGMPNSRLDAIVWRALTTGKAKLAEGGVYVRGTRDTILWDSGTLGVAYDNTGQGGAGIPGYMHKDSSFYHGATLYLDDSMTVPFDIFSRGWAIGQRLPGYYIDTSVAGRAANIRGSRWETRAADIWDTTTQTYTLILSHPMNTGYVDDLDLTTMDSVKTEVGIFDNQLELNVGGVRRGYTKPFYLILH